MKPADNLNGVRSKSLHQINHTQRNVHANLPEQKQKDPCKYCPSKNTSRANPFFSLINTTLFNKYSSSQNYYYAKEVNEIISSARTSAVINFKDLNSFIENEENLKRFYKVKEYPVKAKLLSEYYKFHRDIPRMFMLPTSNILNKFHDRKRKIEYNKITKLLNDEGEKSGIGEKYLNKKINDPLEYNQAAWCRSKSQQPKEEPSKKTHYLVDHAMPKKDHQAGGRCQPIQDLSSSNTINDLHCKLGEIIGSNSRVIADFIDENESFTNLNNFIKFLNINDSQFQNTSQCFQQSTNNILNNEFTTNISDGRSSFQGNSKESFKNKIIIKKTSNAITARKTSTDMLHHNQPNGLTNTKNEDFGILKKTTENESNLWRLTDSNIKVIVDNNGNKTKVQSLLKQKSSASKIGQNTEVSKPLIEDVLLTNAAISQASGDFTPTSAELNNNHRFNSCSSAKSNMLGRKSTFQKNNDINSNEFNERLKNVSVPMNSYNMQILNSNINGITQQTTGVNSWVQVSGNASNSTKTSSQISKGENSKIMSINNDKTSTFLKKNTFPEEQQQQFISTANLDNLVEILPAGSQMHSNHMTKSLTVFSVPVRNNLVSEVAQNKINFKKTILNNPSPGNNVLLSSTKKIKSNMPLQKDNINTGQELMVNKFNVIINKNQLQGSGSKISVLSNNFNERSNSLAESMKTISNKISTLQKNNGNDPFQISAARKSLNSIYNNAPQINTKLIGKGNPNFQTMDGNKISSNEYNLLGSDSKKTLSNNSKQASRIKKNDQKLPLRLDNLKVSKIIQQKDPGIKNTENSTEKVNSARSIKNSPLKIGGLNIKLKK